MKLPLKFGLVAVKKFDGTFMVREWYEAKKFDGIAGKPAVQACDFVDDAIRASHAEEYEAFHAYVETNAERLYPEAIKVYPEVLFNLIPEEISTPATPEVKGDEE